LGVVNTTNTETVFWTLNRLVPIEVHYMEKNPGIIKNLNFFLTEERTTWISWKLLFKIFFLEKQNSVKI